MNVFFVSLGCDKNLVDSEHMLGILQESGYHITEDEQQADIIIVKPGLPYLDVLRAVKASCNIPVASYSVSGEYAMMKAACVNGWLNEKNIVLESAYSIARAGADIIISYYALDLTEWL